MYLGVNYSGNHDSSIALVDRDGNVVFAASEERYSRTKKDGRFPKRCIEQIDLSQVSHVAVPYLENPVVPDEADAFFKGVLLDRPFVDLSQFPYPPQWRERLDSLGKPLTFVDHQHSHAACSYFLSGFERSLVITSDYGAKHCGWNMGFYLATPDGIEPLHQASQAHFHPLCCLYSTMTAVLGFRPNMHEGKITGLAAYGQSDAELEERIWRLYAQIQENNLPLYEWVGLFDDSSNPAIEPNPALVTLYREQLAAYSREQIANAVQRLTEQKVLTLIERICGEVLCDSVALAGGLFANVKLNMEIKRAGFRSVFVCPPMGDEGVALGAAIVARAQHLGCGLRGQPVKHVFWGTTPASDTAEDLKQLHVSFEKPADLAEAIAEQLSQGKIVVRVAGRMEFGPRALGHRSLLCQPTDPTVNDWLNKKLRRTEFMPFAPIVLAERAHELFDLEELTGAEHTAQFMTICFHCTDKFRELCPAVVHVDGTARPQFVYAETQPELHAILTAYERRTGLPALINTSFNVHDEPIVASVKDAVVAFFQSELDYLALDDCLIDRLANPAWATIVSATGNRLLKEHKAHAATTLDHFSRLVIKLQSDKAWFRQQEQNLRAELNRSVNLISNQQAWIAKLESDKEYFEGERTRLIGEWKAQQERCAILEADCARLEAERLQCEEELTRLKEQGWLKRAMSFMW